MLLVLAAQSAPGVGTRLALVASGVLLTVAAVAAFTVFYALKMPTSLTAQPEAAGPTIHLETTAAVGSALDYPRPADAHPDWVGYLPTTILRVPANSVVTMIIDQDDGASGLRNEYWAKAQGVVGGAFHMSYFDDQGTPAEGDFMTIDPTAAAHTFAIPDLGVSVPLLGLSDKAPSGSKNVITFKFHTGAKGVYHWQCFVPCGAGTILGNGGPMQTLGYMGGLLIVG
jgi:hypothetical protein